MALGSWLVDLELGFGKPLATSASVGLVALPSGAIAIAVAAGIAVLAAGFERRDVWQ